MIFGNESVPEWFNIAIPVGIILDVIMALVINHFIDKS
jgi:predicted cation transporter